MASDPPAVLFDWDGTLLDSAPVTGLVWRAVLSRLGVGVPGDTLDSLFGLGWPGAYHHLAAVAGPGAAALPGVAAMAELLRRERPAHLGLLRLFDDALPCLRGLHRAGLRVAVVTSSSRQRLAGDLGVVHIPDGLVDVVVTGDEAAADKPAPDPYLLALRRLGGPVRALAVEDSEVGAASARRAGLPVVRVLRGVAPHGIGAGMATVDTLDPTELRALLRDAGAVRALTT